MKLEQFGYMIIHELGSQFHRRIQMDGGYRMVLHEQVVTARSLRERYMFTEVMALLPDGWELGHDKQTQALLHMERGIALFHVEGWRKAQADFAKSYSLLSHVVDTENACWVVQVYAWSLGKIGDYERGIPMIVQAIERYRPDDVLLGYLLWNLGNQYWNNGETQESLDALRKSMRIMFECGHGDVFCVAVELAGHLLDSNKPTEALEVLGEVSPLLIVRNEHWRAKYDNLKARCNAALGNIESVVGFACSAYLMAGKAGEAAEQSEALLTLATLPGIPAESVRTLSDYAVDLSVVAMRGELLNSALTILRSGGE